MSPVPVSPRRVFGVDFSAARDAGDHTWLCRAHPGSDGIRIESVDPLSALPGGAVDLAAAMRALVGKVTESPRSAWGFDFSFALPAEVLDVIAPAARTYGAQLDVVASFGDADALRERCAAAVPGGESRRRTDNEASTTFSPYNLRIYKQTYHGMVDVLRALHGRPEVAILPLDSLPSGDEAAGAHLPFNRTVGTEAPHVYLMEVCPASVLTALDLSKVGYKGDEEQAAAKRQAIFRHLVDAGLVRPAPRALRNRVIEQPGGDALDAVLAAVGAWHGYRDHDHAALHADPVYAREGFVYT
ncbi:MAG: DUF429 domain-containing protein [Acidobacteriota bacterium]|jgi:hypothetical protein